MERTQHQLISTEWIIYC